MGHHTYTTYRKERLYIDNKILDKYTLYRYIKAGGEKMDLIKKKKIIDRLRRIEGQIRGLERLVGSDTPCLDILTQVAAVTAAMKKTGAEVVRAYLEECLAKAPSTEGETLKEKMMEFQRSLTRYIDMV